ncbi:MAG: MotA/TolQ/ExbB proton channel family protein [Lacipirellulaceae bacterium]
MRTSHVLESLLAPLAEVGSGAWLWELVTAGGPVGQAITGTLVVVSVAAVALVIEQLLTLTRERLAPDGLAERVARALEAGDLATATEACNRQPSLLADALRAGLVEAATTGPATTWPAVEKGIEDAAGDSAVRLLRRLDYLSVIGNLGPMLGLLGTVVGMLMAFAEVASTEGGASAAQLASGIYQALVTTVLGLVIAIPSLAAHAVLRNRLDNLVADAIGEAERATRPLKRAIIGGKPARHAQGTP